MRSVLSTAVLAAAAMAGMGQSAEVVPSRGGLGDWMERNNKRRMPKRARPAVKQPQRLQRATGPGSLNEANELRALVEAGKGDEAAKYYERCHQINYRAGKPKMRWGDEWYRRYKAGDVRARGVES
jgi:hypothetical protein